MVFITGDPDYASKGYDVDAAGYLIKPVRREELYAVMDKCILSLKRAEWNYYGRQTASCARSIRKTSSI